MNNPSFTIEISRYPELSRLAEEVALTKHPRELKHGTKTLAVIIPAEAATKIPRKITKKAYNSSLAALGSWHDVDADTILTQLYQAREEGSRPTTKP